MLSKMLSTTWIVVIVIVVLFIVAILLGAYDVRKAVDSYSATLTAFSEPGVQISLMNGTFHGVLTGNTLVYNYELFSVRSALVEVTLNQGSCATAGGLVLASLSLPRQSSGTNNWRASGTVLLSPAAVTALKSLQSHVQVVTESHPNGEICGNITKKL
jgi:hypothetical protein